MALIDMQFDVSASVNGVHLTPSNPHAVSVLKEAGGLEAWISFSATTTTITGFVSPTGAALFAPLSYAGIVQGVLASEQATRVVIQWDDTSLQVTGFSIFDVIP